jgi:hypothetical protein
MTATCCYICKDECESNLVTEFEGEMKPVCMDCADGIMIGVRILKDLNATGETSDK